MLLILYIALAKHPFNGLNLFHFYNIIEQESRLHRTADVHALVHKLPEVQFKMLDIMISHLKKYDCSILLVKSYYFNRWYCSLCGFIVSLQKQIRI